MIDHVTDWRLRLLGRLAEQFKGLPNLEAVVAAFAVQVQELEESLQALFTITSIEDSTGAQLRVLGKHVGQPYTGESDPIYRLRLRARIRANRSSGTPEELYAIFVALFGMSGRAEIILSQHATLTFRVLAPVLDPPTAEVLRSLFTAGKDAGVRLILEWPTAPDLTSFEFAGSTDGTGLGFSDSSNPSSGGQLAGAAQS